MFVCRISSYSEYFAAEVIFDVPKFHSFVLSLRLAFRQLNTWIFNDSDFSIKVAVVQAATAHHLEFT